MFCFSLCPICFFHVDFLYLLRVFTYYLVGIINKKKYSFTKKILRKSTNRKPTEKFNLSVISRLCGCGLNLGSSFFYRMIHICLRLAWEFFQPSHQKCWFICSVIRNVILNYSGLLSNDYRFLFASRIIPWFLSRCRTLNHRIQPKKQ